MNAVRDVRDRHLVRRPGAEQRLPHLAGDLAVAQTDRVRPSREPQRERRHPRPLVRARARAAHVEEAVGVDSEPAGELRERLEERPRLIRLVPCRYGRMRREHAPLPCRGESVVERLARSDAPGGELERGERRVPLVEVEDAGLDAQRVERADGADPEQAVLAEPRERVALVEARGDPAVDRIVLVQLRVEEVQRHTADLRAPDVEGDLAAEERERQPERRAVGPRHLHRGQVLGDDLRPVLVLEAVPVDALLEVALPVEEADADHRDGEVACLLEDVTRECAEAARVDGQRGVDPELGAHEHDRPLEAVDRSLGPHPVLLEDAREALDPVACRRVAGKAVRRVRGEVPELAHGVAAVDLPGVRVERAEELGPVRIPRPAVVEGDAGERRQLRRQAPREAGGALVGLPGSRERGDVDQAGRAHGTPS